MAAASFRFTVAGKPATQGSKRALGSRNGGRIVMVESSKRLPGWRNDVAFAAQQARPAGWPTTGAMRVQAHFTFARPLSHHTAGRRDRPLKATAPQHHITIAGDVDKLARALLDAMTAAACWADDAQVIDLHCTRGYAEPGQPEGVAVILTALEHPL